MPPAASPLFEKRGLDTQKLLLQGARILLSFVAEIPIGAVVLFGNTVKKLWHGVCTV
jgi:hypothetical protein